MTSPAAQTNLRPPRQRLVEERMRTAGWREAELAARLAKALPFLPDFLVMKTLAVLLAVTVAANAQWTVFGPADQPPKIPEPIVRLLQWPSTELISRKQVAPSATNGLSAVFTAKSWLRNVVDPSWLPPE